MIKEETKTKTTNKRFQQKRKEVVVDISDESEEEVEEPVARTRSGRVINKPPVFNPSKRARVEEDFKPMLSKAINAANSKFAGFRKSRRRVMEEVVDSD